MMKKLIVIICTVLLYTPCISGQQGFEAGAWLGAAQYFGDLNTSFGINRPGVSFGIIGRYNFNNRLSLRLSGGVAQLSAYDSDSDNSFERARNLHFKSSTFDGSAALEFNFLPYTHGSKDEFFSPYIFGGFSIIHFNPEAELDGTWYELRDLGTEGQFRGEEYYSITGGLNYGMGLKLDFTYEWSLNIELGVRQLFNDYLDDVSTIYPDADDLEAIRPTQNASGENIAVLFSDRSLESGLTNQAIGESGRQRGNSNDNDSYAILGVGLVYYFGDLKCPPFSKRY